MDERREYYCKFMDLAKKDEIARIPVNLHALRLVEMSRCREDDIKGRKLVIDYYELRKKIRRVEAENSYDYAYTRDQCLFDETVVTPLGAQLLRSTYDDVHLERYEAKMRAIVSDMTEEHIVMVRLVEQLMVEKKIEFDLEKYMKDIRDGYDHFLDVLQPVEECSLPIERGPEERDDRQQHSDDLDEAQTEVNNIITWLDNSAQSTLIIADNESHIKTGKSFKTPFVSWAFPENIPRGYNLVAVEGVPVFVVTRRRYIYEQTGHGEMLIGKLGLEDLDDGYYLMSTTLQLIDVYVHRGVDYRHRQFSDRQILCAQLKDQYPHLCGIRQRVPGVLWISPGSVTSMYRTCGVLSGFSLYVKRDGQYMVTRSASDEQCYLVVFGGPMRVIFKMCKKNFDIAVFLTMLGNKVLWYRDKSLFRLALERAGYSRGEIEVIWQ